MKINEAIKKAMEHKGMNQGDMAKALKVKTANQVSSKLMNENWTIKSILNYLDILGFEVVIRPRKRASADEIVVDES